MYDNTYICQKVKNWLKEEEKKEKEEEMEKIYNTTKLLKKLDNTLVLI